ncbi:MAG: cytochrome c [Cyclobacteriaceae bacterium]
MNNFKNLTGLLLLSLAALIFVAFTVIQEQKPWPVPEKYVKTENPVKADAESIKLGKGLYSKHCQSCHGKKGMGDGSKAAELDTPSGDFTTPEFKKQVDGELFYKTKEGREDMPSFKKKIPDEEDHWAIINYVRTF